MDFKQGKKLKTGDRVLIWHNTPDVCSGTVIETGYNAVKIKWDDGQVGIIHLRDLGNVDRYNGDTSITPPQQVS